MTGPTEPGKATPVTARLLFKSRYAIITPDAPGLNISRAIREEDIREALGTLAEEAMAGADPRLGLILRSAAAEADEDEVADDIDTLGGLIVTLAGRVPALGEMVKGPDGLSFEILDSDQRRVKRLTIHCRSEPAAEEPAMEPG